MNRFLLIDKNDEEFVMITRKSSFAVSMIYYSQLKMILDYESGEILWENPEI